MHWLISTLLVLNVNVLAAPVAQHRRDDENAAAANVTAATIVSGTVHALVPITDSGPAAVVDNTGPLPYMPLTNLTSNSSVPWLPAKKRQDNIVAAMRHPKPLQMMPLKNFSSNSSLPWLPANKRDDTIVTALRHTRPLQMMPSRNFSSNSSLPWLPANKRQDNIVAAMRHTKSLPIMSSKNPSSNSSTLSPAGNDTDEDRANTVTPSFSFPVIPGMNFTTNLNLSSPSDLEGNEDPTSAFTTLLSTPHHLETIDSLGQLEFCVSWVVFNDRWYEGAHIRYRWLFGSNNPEMRLPYLGKKSWENKYKWINWLWSHRLNDGGKSHQFRFECTLSTPHNRQIFFHEDLKTWVMDVSERRGPVGDALMLCMWRHMKWTWEQYTGCHNVGYVPENYDGRA